MSQIFPPQAAPALVLAGGALAVLILELVWSSRKAATASVTVAVMSLAGAGAALWWPAGPGERLTADPLSHLTYGVVLVGALVAVTLSAPAMDQGEPAAFLALVLLAGAGMGLAGSATSLPGVFLGLELLSLSLYVLVAYRRRDARSLEAALKYFVLGSVASGLLLLGIGLVYHATGELVLQAAAASPADASGAAVAGFTLMVVAIAFKLALVPFHMWAPDAYEGATLGVTAFMSVATKATTLAVLLRVALAAPEPARSALPALCALSMVVGSLGALRQRELRRLMAYSGIANAGYLLVGLPHFTGQGIEAALFYLGAYALMNLGLFVSAALLRPGLRESYPLEAFDGLAAANPVAGWSAAVFLLALVGMPLTGGFVGKVLLMGAAVREGAAWLALVLAASTAILSYPYLRLAYRILRFTPPDAALPEHLRPARRGVLGALAAAAAAATVLLGVWPQGLLWLVQAAAAALR